MNYLRCAIIILFICFSTSDSAFSKSKEEIKSEITKLLDHKYLKNSNYSIRVVLKDKKETLFSINEKSLLSPASTIKILTTSTAIAKLPSNFAVKTLVYSDRKPVNGDIKGNIYLKGFGNPLFSYNDLAEFASGLYAQGIRRVEGDVIVDDSYFDQKLNRTEWIGSNERNEDEGAISAVSLDYNHVGVYVHATTKIKSTPEIRVYPTGAIMKVVNKLKVAKVSRRRESVILSLTENNGNYVLTASGKIRPGHYKYRSIRIKNPSVFTGALFRYVLTSKGIAISGRVKTGELPSNAVELASHKLPIDSLLRVINKHSDNFSADHLLKILGAELGDKNGTAESGNKAINNFIAENNIDTAHYKIFDGSGLSRKNRLTAYMLTQILYNIAINKHLFERFYNSLSIAGVDGTLKHRMNDFSEPETVRGKTGTLSDVCTLAGYTYSSKGELIVYTIFMNDIKRGIYEMRKIQDKIIAVISEFSG